MSPWHDNICITWKPHVHPLQTYDPMPVKFLTWTFLCCQKGMLAGFGYDFQEVTWSTPTKHFSSQKTLPAHCSCTKGFYQHNHDNRNSKVQRGAENLPTSPLKKLSSDSLAPLPSTGILTLSWVKIGFHKRCLWSLIHRGHKLGAHHNIHPYKCHESASTFF